MNNLLKQLFLFQLFLMVFSGFSSCKSARKVQTAITKKDTTLATIIDNPKADSIHYIKTLLTEIEKNRITEFNTFSAKIKVDYKDKEGSQPELTVFIRMKKDSLIWISINATIVSYEALRIIISPDSVKVLNKRDKIVQLRSVGYLQELTQLPFDFTTLQDFLLGNPVYLDSNVVSYKKNEQSVTLMNIGQYFKHLLTINSSNYTLEQSKLDDIDPLRNRTCFISYSGYEKWKNLSFATRRRISVSEKSKLDIDMDIRQFSFNEPLTYPFSIPKKYAIN